MKLIILMLFIITLIGSIYTVDNDEEIKGESKIFKWFLGFLYSLITLFGMSVIALIFGYRLEGYNGFIDNFFGISLIILIGGFFIYILSIFTGVLLSYIYNNIIKTLNITLGLDLNRINIFNTFSFVISAIIYTIAIYSKFVGLNIIGSLFGLFSFGLSIGSFFLGIIIFTVLGILIYKNIFLKRELKKLYEKEKFSGNELKALKIKEAIKSDYFKELKKVYQEN